MVEQRTIINHVLYSILIHPDWKLPERQEHILKPVKFGDDYFAQIPNFIGHPSIPVKKDTEIKVVYFNRN